MANYMYICGNFAILNINDIELPQKQQKCNAQYSSLRMYEIDRRV